MAYAAVSRRIQSNGFCSRDISRSEPESFHVIEAILRTMGKHAVLWHAIHSQRHIERVQHARNGSLGTCRSENIVAHLCKATVLIPVPI